MTMARYLNPQKISLLVLASLYCEASGPSSATIPILSFLTSHLLSSPADSTTTTTTAGAGAQQQQPHQQSKHSIDCILTLHHFERVLAAHPYHPPSPPADDSAPGSSPAPPSSTLYDAFLTRLWAIDSLDALHAFFDALSDLLLAKQQQQRPPPPPADEEGGGRRIRLSRTSPLGVFVRRAQLEFQRLQFHDAAKLWLAFVNYRRPTAGRARGGDGAAAVFDANLEELGASRGDGLWSVAYGALDGMGEDEGLASADEVERVLAFQIDRLQKYGNRVPDDMRERLRKMLGPTGAVPSLAHFVKFFDAWRAGDYTSSFDNLHRYFDYTMQTRDKTYYQYALLHMAILQADFGCFSEAIAAMNETIATARENQDMSCLNFSLSWLNHLAKAHPKQIRASGYGGMLGSERDGLSFLKAKARETKMWSLLSSTLLSEAKMLLSNGSSVPRAFEQIYQSAHLNVVHNIRSNIGSQMLMQASLYGRLGVTNLSDVVCDILRECYGNVCPIEEILRSSCHSAYIKAQAGRYAEAFEMLDSIDQADHRTLKFHQYISNYSALLKAKRALRRGDLRTSNHLLSSLRAFRPTDPEIQFQLSILEIDALTRAGDFSAAYARIEELLADLKSEDGDVYQRVQLLILKASLFAQTGVPEKGFSLAMRAASAAHRARLWPTLWEALAVVMGVLVELGECRAARRVGDAVCPLALEVGDEALCAKLYLTQADACIGIAGEEQQRQQHQQQQHHYAIAASTSVSASATTAAATAATTPATSDSAAGINPAIRSIEDALLFLDRAKQCFVGIEDVRGECECIAKRALVEKLKVAIRAGDAVGAGAGSGGAVGGWKDDTAVEEAVGYIGRYKSVFEGESGETVG